jgi:type IV pilus assembly protein PilX
MMRSSVDGQRGAILPVTLILLLVITALAVTGSREAVLEGRITANRGQALQFDNSVDAALREAEFRYFNPANLREKLEPREGNCSTSNTLKTNGANKPCLLPVQKDKDVVRSFVLTPQALKEETESKKKFLSGSWNGLVWMPYRGRDHAKVSETEVPAAWNTYLITGGPTDEQPIHVEYGAFGEGKGTFFYLANGRVVEGDAGTAAQSTFANVYVGLNN